MGARRVVLLTAGLLVAVPASAGAEPQPTTDTRDAARTIAEEGLDLIDRGELEAGIAKLLEAERLFHAPTHHLFIARAYAQMGKFGSAERRYRMLVDERLPNYAPDPFREAQELGRAELATIQPKVPHVRIDVRAPAGSPVLVDVDGEQIARWSEAIPVDSGKHRVTVAIPGHAPRVFDVALGAGEERSVAVDWTEAPPHPIGVQPTSDAVESGSDGGREIALWSAFGVGGAGIALGAVTGILSLAEVADLEERCPSKHCDPADESTADTARALGTTSTVGFIVGGVGVAAGVALLLWPTSPSGAPIKKTSAWSLHPSPGGMTLRGRF